MLSLALSSLIAVAAGQEARPQLERPARERGRVELQVEHPVESEYVPQWTQLGLEGGTIVGITRLPDGRLWGGGRYAPFDFGPFSHGDPFIVESPDLGAQWRPIDVESLPGITFLEDFAVPATASDGTRLLLTTERIYRWRDAINEWVGLPAADGAAFRPMVSFDVGRGLPAHVLLGLGSRDLGTIQFSPELVVADVSQGITTRVTPPQATDMEPLALAISDLDGNVWAAAFRSPLGHGLLTLTSDGGQDWATLPLPPSGRINALTWQGERLLAAVEGAGIFQFLGGSWQRLDDGSSRLKRIRVLEVSVHDAGLIFAGGPDGLSRSANGGSDWTHGIEGTLGQTVTSIYPDPEDPALVFIGVLGEGVLASDDGGTSFFSASEGIAAATVLDVTSNPANPRHLAVVQAREDGPRIRESFDGGASWTPALATRAVPESLAFGHDGALWMLGQRAGDPLDMGLYRRDGGRWLRAALPASVSGSVQLEFLERGGAPGTLYAGGGGTSGSIDGTGLAWRSDDDGRSWQLMWDEPASVGRSFTARALVEMPGFDGQELIIDRWERSDSASTPFTFRSSDAGASWGVLASATTANERWLCADPDQPGRLISVVSFVFGTITELQLDSGIGWQPVEGRVPRAPTTFACWFGEEGLTYLAGTTTVPRVYYGQEGSDARPAPAEGEWPARQTLAVHRWAGGLLLGTGSGLWRAPLEEVAAAPVVLSATDSGARMTTRPRLTWTGGASWVRILRDGEEVAFVPNTGEWTARLLRDRSGPSEYAVCNGFDEACSDAVVPGG